MSREEEYSLEGLLTYGEMLNTLKNMKNDKSPVSDRFTVEFLKVFWMKLGHFIVRSVNHAYTIGSLSVTRKQGIIT